MASFISLWFSEISDGGADALVHFGMAQGTWKHPELLLDLWGKPLFTFLSSPFAQGGMRSHQFFNVLIGMLTAYFTWKSAEKLNIRNAWTVIPFLAFFPVWFTLSFSSMTEPLFACLLIAAVYLYVSDRLVTSAILVSFLPFARQEGFAFIGLFLILFLIKKQFRKIPILFTGIVFFSLLGWPVFGDIFWVLHRQPYHADDLTTPGGLFHYVSNYEVLFGLVGSILLLAGTLWLFRKMRSGETNIFLLIAGGFWMILIAHSYVYYRGQAGSVGLLRLMGTVAPLAALLVVYGLEGVGHFVTRPKDRLAISVLALLFQMGATFYVVDLPLRNDPVKRALTDFSVSLPEEERLHKKIYATDPQLWFYLERDYWDTAKWVPVNHPGHYRRLTKGSLFITENMFGYWLSSDTLARKENLQLRYVFKPEEEFTFGHGPYSISVYDVVK